tara:strand:+ start:241 stop:507 length:267 start_codon:yes stop_codon:yes gene_type:complete
MESLNDITVKSAIAIVESIYAGTVPSLENARFAVDKGWFDGPLVEDLELPPILGTAISNPIVKAGWPVQYRVFQLGKRSMWVNPRFRR